MPFRAPIAAHCEGVAGPEVMFHGKARARVGECVVGQHHELFIALVQVQRRDKQIVVHGG